MHELCVRNYSLWQPIKQKLLHFFHPRKHSVSNSLAAFIYEYWDGFFFLCLLPNILTQGAVSIYSILQTMWIITAWTTVSPIRKTQRAGVKLSMHNRACDILNLFYFCSTAVRKPISFKAVALYTSVFLHILQASGAPGFSKGAHVQRDLGTHWLLLWYYRYMRT